MALTKISTAGVKDDAITSGKIPANAVGSSEIADTSVTLAKLEHGTSSTDGKFLRANNGADPTFENVPAGGISDVVSDTSPQLGGDLQSNGNDIDFADNDKAIFGTGNDLQIYHDGSNSWLDDAGTGALNIRSQAGNVHILGTASNEYCAKFVPDGAVELYHNNTKKLSTTANGICFNSDTAAANALDDYEEGTFTPDWRGSNVLGTTTYGFNEASYVKIGNLVTVQGFSEIQSSSGGGPWFIDNMPFNTAGDRAHRCVGTIGLENFNFDSDVVDTFCWIDRNNNNLVLKGTRDNATPSTSISADNDTGWGITWCITYRTS